MRLYEEYKTKEARQQAQVEHYQAHARDGGGKRKRGLALKGVECYFLIPESRCRWWPEPVGLRAEEVIELVPDEVDANGVGVLGGYRRRWVVTPATVTRRYLETCCRKVGVQHWPAHARAAYAAYLEANPWKPVS